MQHADEQRSRLRPQSCGMLHRREMVHDPAFQRKSAMSTGGSVVQDTGSIEFSDLVRSLKGLTTNGRIGSPVCLRLHWQIEPHASEAEALRDAAILADECFGAAAPVWQIRQSGNRQWNVLGTDPAGWVLLATVCRAVTPAFTLTLMGNHGTVRLEHARLSPRISAVELQDGGWCASLIATPAVSTLQSVREAELSRNKNVRNEKSPE